MELNIDIDINALYYIAHIDNLMSITTIGILSHARVKKDEILYTPIYNGYIVEARKERVAPNGKGLWGFANLFFNPRNPMLYRVLREKPAKDIVVISINPNILNRDGIFITTGNARVWQSEILMRDIGLLKIKEIQKNFKLDKWAYEDGSKTKIMAECLVPDKVPSEYLQGVYVANHKVANNIKSRYPNIKIDIIPEPHMFFQPSGKNSTTNNLNSIEDRFFSPMKKLSIVVNSFETISNGLTGRIKYHFIGSYHKYKNLRKRKKLAKNIGEGQLLLFSIKAHWIQSGNIIGIGTS